MKYIDADLLRKEIEKKTYGEQGFRSEDSEYGYRSCARDLLDFIDSLQQDQPEVDLDEEIDKYLEPISCTAIRVQPFNSLERCARHFYELGRKARKEE